MPVLASIFSPLQRLLAHPKLPWMMLWIGLAFLIVSLVVMIRTSWGQSRPLRKCAGLSLLAHLLLLCYATTIEIVMSVGGSSQYTNMNVTLVDGTQGGIDHPLAEPDGDITARTSSENVSDPNAEALDRPEPDDLAVVRPQEAAGSMPTEGNPLEIPIANPPLPPLLNAAKVETPTMPAEAIDEPKPSEKAHSETPPPVSQPNAPELPPATSDFADRSQPIAKPVATLPPVDSTSPLPKLPEPPTTADPSQWTAGQPSAGSQLPGALADVSSAPTVPIPSSRSDDNAPSGPLSESTSPPIAAKPVPEIYSDRMATGRTEIARRYGGSPEAVASVEAALYWLAANQSDDGRWDPDQFGAGKENAVLGHNRQGAGANADTGITGLALLAFLGSGHTHQKGEYSKTVQRGLEFLLSTQAADGNLAGAAETYAFMYSHGMATFALSEAYAMTGDKRFEGAVRKAINYTISAQLPSTGGWRYKAKERPEELGDTSQLGWQLMAIKSAELAGIAIPARVEDGAIRYLKIVSTGPFGGKASYQPGPPKPTAAMTAEALVCRQFLGMARDNPASNEAGDYLLQDLPSSQKINLYYWYYGTLGMFQLQGQHWERWNQAMQATLVSHQRGDGKFAGSWDPDCQWGGYGGRVYSTALSALCLEVYYRYLPIYRLAEKQTHRSQ
ncbi:MAG: hypothetical protein IT427_11340 [Pirellulales bacterium]|nr:hypothetical protein [Pirellulales bacterium]